MNRGEFQTSLVQQMIWSGGGGNTTGSSNIMSNGFKSCHEDQQEASRNLLPSLSSPSLLFSNGQQFPHTSSSGQPVHIINGGAAASLPSLDDGGSGQDNHMPESWSQMLLGEFAGERYTAATACLLSKGVENWGDHAAAASACMVGGGGVEEEGSAMPQPLYSLYGGSHSHLAAGDHEMPPAPAAGAKSQLSQMLLASSPRSCVTTSLGSNMLDFSNSVPPAPDQLKSHHHQSDNSSECNSTATGSAIKKPRVQASSSAQSTLKVRKERLGDRITALHQIVSPFGKTDTASVLQETIGYIRFLLGQIEALSYPYMGHGNGTSIQTGPTGERNPAGLLPEYPGQLLNHNNNTGARQPAVQPDEQQAANDETKKDLRSRGLCLVPVSCTSHFGGDNAADYWAPAPLGGILR